jgi:hypothetical protein
MPTKKEPKVTVKMDQIYKVLGQKKKKKKIKLKLNQLNN